MNCATVACAAAALDVVVGGRHVTVAPAQRLVLGRGAGVDLALTIRGCHAGISYLSTPRTAGRPSITAATAHSTVASESARSRLRLHDVVARWGVHGQRIELHPRGINAQSDHTSTTVAHSRPSPMRAADRSSVTAGARTATTWSSTTSWSPADMPASTAHNKAGGLPTLAAVTARSSTASASRAALVTERDVIEIGHARLQLRDGRLSPLVNTGGSGFEADDLTVTTPAGRRLLQSVGFTLPGRGLLAVIGPSEWGSQRCSTHWRGIVPLTGAPFATPAATCTGTTSAPRGAAAVVFRWR